MSTRYFVITQFAVEADDPQAAEQLVARRIQASLGRSTVVCEQCGHENERHVGEAGARVVIEASTDTDEEVLRGGPPMLVEQTGYVPVEGGKDIGADG